MSKRREELRECQRLDRLCVCSLVVATLALHRQTPSLAKYSMWHMRTHTYSACSEHKHSSSICTFTFPLQWHRKAKFHVSFSYRGNPQHRLPLFTSIFYQGLCFRDMPRGKMLCLFFKADTAYKHSWNTRESIHLLMVRHIYAFFIALHHSYL